LQFKGYLVEEMVLSGTSVNRTFNTAYYTPGQNSTYTVSVFDSQGNKQTADTSIPPRPGFNRSPQPFIGISAPTTFVGNNIILDATNSSDPDGNSSAMQVE